MAACPALRAALLGVHHHQAGQAGHFVGVPLYGDAFLELGEAHRTGHLGDDRVGVGIPAGDDLTRINVSPS